MSTNLSHAINRGGKQAGRETFVELLSIIRPVVMIAHGVGTAKELKRVLRANLPSLPERQADGVMFARVNTRLFGDAYASMIFVIPSFAPPKWNAWQTWAQPHLAEVFCNCGNSLTWPWLLLVFQDDQKATPKQRRVAAL